MAFYRGKVVLFIIFRTITMNKRFHKIRSKPNPRKANPNKRCQDKQHEVLATERSHQHNARSIKSFRSMTEFGYGTRSPQTRLKSFGIVVPETRQRSIHRRVKMSDPWGNKQRKVQSNRKSRSWKCRS